MILLLHGDFDNVVDSLTVLGFDPIDFFLVQFTVEDCALNGASLAASTEDKQLLSAFFI